MQGRARHYRWRGRARACWRARFAVKYICDARVPRRLITVITVLKLSLPCRRASTAHS